MVKRQRRSRGCQVLQNRKPLIGRRCGTLNSETSFQASLPQDLYFSRLAATSAENPTIFGIVHGH